MVNTLQNLLFCIPKAALLHGKSVGFAAQNSRFRNAKTQLSLFKTFFFTKPGLLTAFATSHKKKNNLSTINFY
ncbi:hypothetical protein CTM46_07500 [Prevotella intermedia]|uniref:Uncharacterized protein n=1 Tax=Prevotella intermedia TaxID=28131 RepID=A0A2D3LL62_PREIN|nr:hypothetical protein [Prevotella intermedia]ATV31296.1 hypothetical protein CTM46_07500 [Prevotella intermedia]